MADVMGSVAARQGQVLGGCDAHAGEHARVLELVRVGLRIDPGDQGAGHVKLTTSNSCPPGW